MVTVFLASPVFHGYWHAIAAALEARGHRVVPHLYDQRSALGTVAYRVRGDTARHRHQLTDRAIAAWRASRADVVLTVKGDQFTDDWWSAIGSTPRVTWLYDELRRTHHPKQRWGALGPLATYSRQDVATLAEAGVAATYVPLAFDHRLPWTPRTPRAEVVFVGARYPSRAATLTQIAATGVAVRTYGRDWSHRAIDRLRSPGPRLSLPAGPTLLRDEAYAAMAAGLATVNLHGDQDGFTMRTFEASGVGGLQLIDRADVEEFYEPGREVVTFASAAEVAEWCRRAETDRAWAAGVREAGQRRTLAEHTFDHRVATLEQLWG